MRIFQIAALLAALALPSPLLAANLKIGLVLDKNGKQDKGFNASALQGLEKAKAAFKIQGEAIEASGDGGHEPLMREFAKKGYDLVIALGGARSEALKKVAAEFPKTRFAIIDGEVKAKNVRSILFKEHEGSYLVGAVAGYTSKTGKVGFVGGMDIPVIRRYEVGFAAGARKANPKAQVTVNYIGNTSAAWGDTGKAKELALKQYDAGADVIFVASGGANMGVFDAAVEKSKYAIGVSNQNWIKPGHILTSMRKRVDVAVLITCQDLLTGGFSAEVKHYGLAEQGVDFVIDSHNEKLLPEPLLKKVEALKDQIVEEKIRVPENR